MKNITIAIDGYSSTGKSTVAKQLANRLSYIYVDSGAMYRAITLYAIQHQYISPISFDVASLISSLKSIQLTFKYNTALGFAEMYLNGVNVEKEIRTLEVSNLVSKVAEISEVRRLLVSQQQKMGLNKGVVMDGRDIGTVVFPNAELKLFMNASATTRANRRFKELIKRGDDVTFDQILKNVEYRDHIDSTRADSPLVMADDAIAIDNSNLNLEEQFEYIYEIVLQKLKTF